MSWDVSIFRFVHHYDDISDIPAEGGVLSLGPAQAVRDAISATFSSTSWADPAWGVYDGDAGSIEFNIGDSDPADSLMLHVRATADIVPLILAFCAANQWRAIDMSTPEFLDKDPFSASSLGAVTVIVFRKRPNSSFKPNPLRGSA